MKKLILFAVIVGMITFLHSQEKRYIAVLNLEHAGLSEDDANILTDRLGYELFKTDQFMVLERNKIEEILKEQSFQLSGCTSTECMVEVGKLVGVREIVGGSIGMFGNTYTVNVRLIDVETSAITETAVFDLSGSKDDLLTRGMRKVARDLCRLEEEPEATQTQQIVQSREKQKNPTSQTTSEQTISQRRTTAISPPIQYQPAKKKIPEFKRLAVYIGGGMFRNNFKFSTDGLFFDEFKITPKGGVGSLSGEIYLTKNWGFFGGLTSGSTDVEIPGLVIESDHRFEMVLTCWGINWRPSEYLSAGFGLAYYNVKLELNETDDKEISVKESLFRMGVHLPLSQSLYLNMMVIGTAGKETSGYNQFYGISFHL